ncbi:MAG: prepilin-type N-terminal cleavage/methylation domain-containing protein [Gammaproteobacteria bacterium]|nr:MAG: prepilin-type N-terminal cleavage/methylation domain-containing protein [Gammaproteobacteria bacterium]
MISQHAVAVAVSHCNPNRTGEIKEGGFSLFELLVVIIIISILMILAIQRLLALQVDAERVVMESVVGSLRSALGIKVAETFVRQGPASLATLESSNPMNLLAEVPANYLGELDSSMDPALLERGNWYFDTGNRNLVYLVNNSGYFSGGMPDPTRARFAIRIVYSDKNGNGVYDAGADVIEGLRLAPLESYRWIK